VHSNDCYMLCNENAICIHTAINVYDTAEGKGVQSLKHGSVHKTLCYVAKERSVDPL
jgi:hypothetical protein